MGRTKALLEIDGQTFLSRVVRALSDGGCAPIVVVVAGDPDIAAEASATGARVIDNPHPGEGPITSLRLAIEAIGGDLDGIAYLPIDHPLVTAEVVSLLRDAAETSGAPLTLPIVGSKRGHPALFRRTLFPELTDPALKGGARTVVHAHLAEANLVPVTDPGPITDVDTPEDFEAALRASGGGVSVSKDRIEAT